MKKCKKTGMKVSQIFYCTAMWSDWTLVLQQCRECTEGFQTEMRHQDVTNIQQQYYKNIKALEKSSGLIWTFTFPV